MDLQWLLQVVNVQRQQVAQGSIITLPQGTGIRGLNIEKMIYDESLSITATHISSRCNNVYSNVTELGLLYHNTLESMGNNARVNVSEDATNILVGETIHIVESATSADNAAVQSLYAWLAECDRFTFATDCNGTQDPTSCRNCLQFIWRYRLLFVLLYYSVIFVYLLLFSLISFYSKTRYIGCGFTVCPSIDNVNDPDIDVINSVLFVCHWYWGADLFGFSGDTDWTVPYLPSFVDNFCTENPFNPAGCGDTERIGCDDGICDGCPR